MNDVVVHEAPSIQRCVARFVEAVIETGLDNLLVVADAIVGREVSR